MAEQSECGRRLRLNVSALLSEEVVTKFLVVIPEDAGMDRLFRKIQQTLHRGGILSTVERVMNSGKAVLPHDEVLGDMLRDGDEISAVLRGDDGSLLSTRKSPQALKRSCDSAATTLRAATNLHVVGTDSLDGQRVEEPLTATLTVPPQTYGYAEDSDDELLPIEPTISEYPPAPARSTDVQGDLKLIPGPCEEFESEKLAYDIMQVDHPCDPIAPASYDNDWLVENLTPRLREFVLAHFQEKLITEPKYVRSIGKFVGPRFYQDSGLFISMFMRPQTAVGSDPSATMPVHYNIAKHDVLTFQRKAEAHVERTQQHLELFSATMHGLKALLKKGMSESDHISVMLPHSYQAFDEVEGVMMEVDRPLFTKLDGSNPVIVVDTSGAVGKHLTFVKAALKRALFAHAHGKTALQLIRFAPTTGEPRLWAQGMVPPTEEALQAAEDWIDTLAPVSSARLFNAVRYAAAHQEADAIHILSSGESDQLQHDSVLQQIRAVNTREIAIHTLGVDPNSLGELLLRNIAESNHGDFTLKSFSEGGSSAYCQQDAKWTSWRTNLVNEKSKQLSDSFKKQKMSIGGQIKIIEVMQREEKQKERSWHEEWKCAQRLLLASESRKSTLDDRDALKDLERKTSRTSKARVGGGFAYQTDEVDLSLEHLFEHKSAVPWTANTDTVATGPKVPLSDASQTREARFPPARDLLPDTVVPLRERCMRQRSGRSSSEGPASRGGGGVGGGGGGKRPGGRVGGHDAIRTGPYNPWGAPGAHDRTRRPPSSRRKQAPGPSHSGSASSLRTASADRAAGGSGKSPRVEISEATKEPRSKSPRLLERRPTPVFDESPGPIATKTSGKAAVAPRPAASRRPTVPPPCAPARVASRRMATSSERTAPPPEVSPVRLERRWSF